MVDALAAATNPGALMLPATPSGATNEAALDIRGIKEPVPLGGSYRWLLWWALALATAALGYYLYRKYFKKAAAPKPAVVIPPHRRAKDRLRAAGELLSDPYRFCSLVSDVVRVYLEERFELRAPERTTEEFLEEAKRSPRLTQPQKEMLQEFLAQCDLVKFARHEPSQEQLQALLDAALRLIDETAPVAAPATAPDSTAPTDPEARAA
jgi:hypothetical protein